MIDPRIPTPADTGSLGTQTPGAGELTVLDAVPAFRGLQIAQAVEGLAETRPRSFGGDVGARLLASSFSQLSQELEESRRTLQSKDADLQRLTADLSVSTTRVAVLEERLGAVRGGQRIRQLAVFAGTAIVGVAIELWKSDLVKLAILLAILGVVLLAVGAFLGAGVEK
jgi:hypothetical protein